MTLALQIALLAILIPAAWILGSKTYDAAKRWLKGKDADGPVA